MAAALIPLVAGVLPQIIAAIVGFIHKAAPEIEAANGPQTGPIKFGQLFQAVLDALAVAAKAGQISGVLPSDDQIKLIIQAVITSLQMGGGLGATAVVSDAIGTVAAVLGQQAVTLKAGQTLLITGAN